MSSLLDRDIFHASEHGDINRVRRFIEEEHIDINGKNSEEKTALMIASAKGHFDIVQYLCDHGASIHIQNSKYGVTALFAAVKSGNLEIVQYLIDHRGAHMEVTGLSGETVLMTAAFGGHLDIVKFLCERGANLQATTNDGWTALRCASEQGHKSVVDYLKTQQKVETLLSSRDKMTSLIG